jgi:hypothetical protein
MFAFGIKQILFEIALEKRVVYMRTVRMVFKNVNNSYTPSAKKNCLNFKRKLCKKSAL